MHRKNVDSWKHDHIFDQDVKKSGEQKTVTVVIITAIMMVFEIVAGVLSGSMALLADGLHMASHATALGIGVFAYMYARRRAGDRRFSFGTGKTNALGGFTGAVLLAIFSLVMALESAKRFFSPVSIAYDQAILVAIVGLVVNGIGVFILKGDHHHDNHDHDHGHDHSHKHEHHQDHNLRSAYLHVLADALTSVFAIVALLCAKFWGFNWMDPLMGVVGAVLVIRWSWGLLDNTRKVLLDHEGPESMKQKIKEAVESDGDSRVCDLHLWVIGPNIYSVIIAVVTASGKEPQDYKSLLPSNLGLAHVTVEVNACHDAAHIC